MFVGLTVKSLNEGTRRSRTYYNDVDELSGGHFWDILGRQALGFQNSHARIELMFDQEKVVLRPRFIPIVEIDGASILSDELIVIHPGQDHILNLAGDEFLVTAFKYDQ